MEKQQQYYSVQEMAEMLGYRPMTIYRYISAKTLKAYKIGKEYRIEHSEFTRFMAARQV